MGGGSSTQYKRPRRKREEGDVIYVEPVKASAPRKTEGRLLPDAQGAAKARLAMEINESERLWGLLNAELRKTVAVASSADQEWSRGLREARVQIRARLLAAIMVRDSTQLGMAVQSGAAMGMDLMSKAARSRLEEVLAQEELEGHWRCLYLAVTEVDRIALAFWIDEATSRGIEVPPELHAFLASSRKSSSLVRRQASRERRTLMDWSYEDVLEARVAMAHAEGDAAQLRRLVKEADSFNADSGLAKAALAGLEAEESEAANSRYCGGTFADPELAALSRWSAKALKAELERFGVDISGVFEKEELVQLLASVDGQTASSPQHRYSNFWAPPLGSSSHGPQWRHSAPEAQRPTKLPVRSGRSNAVPSKPARAGRSGQAASGAEWGHEASGAEWGHQAGTEEERARARPRSAAGDAAGSSDYAPPPPSSLPAAMSRAEALLCLGLTGDPSHEALRKAYKKAALQWHPDRPHNRDNVEEATRKFQESRRAYEYLAAAASS